MARMFALTGRNSKRFTVQSKALGWGGESSRPDFGQPCCSHCACNKSLGLDALLWNISSPLSVKAAVTWLAQHFILPVKLCFTAQPSTISALNISCNLVRMMETHFPDQWGEMSLGEQGAVSITVTHPFLSRLHAHASLPVADGWGGGGGGGGGWGGPPASSQVKADNYRWFC